MTPNTTPVAGSSMLMTDAFAAPRIRTPVIRVQNAKTVHRRLTAIRHPHWYREQGACSVPVRVQLSPKNRLADRLNAKRQSIGLRLP